MKKKLVVFHPAIAPYRVDFFNSLNKEFDAIFYFEFEMCIRDRVDRYHGIIKKSFEEFGITFDIYSRTTSATHHQMASDFFRTLYDKGEFIEKISEQYYDEEAKQFLADRYITGTCPHCGNEKAYGDQCEACGTSLSPTDLKDPKSAISGSKPVMRETKHWYLPLDKWEPFLRKWILEDHKEWKPNVYGQCKSWLDMGPVSYTHLDVYKRQVLSGT